MIQQKVSNRQLGGLQGVGAILVIAAVVLLGSAFFSLLERYIGVASSLLFIAFGCAVAWFMMNWFVLAFIYTSNADCLRVCRVYGKRERFMVDVWLNQVQAYGTLEEMKARFPAARASRAVKAQCMLAPLALAYKQDGRIAILVIQPDEAMRAHLIQGIRKGK